MAPFFFSDSGTAPSTWVSPTAPIYWNQTPTATSIVYWIPVNQTTASTITFTNTIIPSTYICPITQWESDWELPINREFVPYTPAIIRRLTDRHDREELAVAAAAQRQAMLERQMVEREARVMAGVRSMELLLAHLTPEQRRTFEENKWFVVEGGRTKRKYKIHAEGHLNANVEVMGENHRLCAHCNYDLPYNDQVLMQKVMLELDEDSFLRVANRRGMR